MYLLPTALWMLVSATVTSLETKRTYSGRITVPAFARRLARVVPYVVINAGMLPHQFSAFAHGLFGPMHSEFERTPKAATVTGRPGPASRRRYPVQVHWPYLLAEAFFVAYHAAWAVLFAMNGLPQCALGSALVAGSVLALAFFYGDHAGRMCFVVDRSRLAAALHPQGWRRVCRRNTESVQSSRLPRPRGVRSG